jgi:outer membrane protein TolC
LRDKRLSLAQSERRAAEEELNLARDRTVREVVKAYNDVKVAFRKREAAVALLTAADRAYAAALESYRHGIATYVDVVNAQTNLTRARTADTETRSLIFSVSAALAFSTGELVPPQ